MSVLKRKDLVIDNSYQHLLSTYSVPGAVPGLFPGTALFNFAAASMFCIKERILKRSYGEFPKVF